jgi:CheY-like chemotaxis protein
MAAADAGHGTVLVVEDNDVVRPILAEIVELCGYEAAEAANGREALDYLHHHEPPCLILLDLAMPVMDGQAFMAEQRKDPRLASVPVVALTGMDDPATAKELEPWSRWSPPRW